MTRPAFKIAGYELKTTTRDDRGNQEIPAFWGSMTAERPGRPHNLLHSVDEAEPGIYFQTTPANGDFSYVIAVEVSDFDSVPADLFTAEIPEAVYAIFTTPASEEVAVFTQPLRSFPAQHTHILPMHSGAFAHPPCKIDQEPERDDCEKGQPGESEDADEQQGYRNNCRDTQRVGSHMRDG